MEGPSIFISIESKKCINVGKDLQNNLLQALYCMYIYIYMYTIYVHIYICLFIFISQIYIYTFTFYLQKLMRFFLIHLHRREKSFKIRYFNRADCFRKPVCAGVRGLLNKNKIKDLSSNTEPHYHTRWTMGFFALLEHQVSNANMQNHKQANSE